MFKLIAAALTAVLGLALPLSSAHAQRPAVAAAAPKAKAKRGVKNGYLAINGVDYYY